MLKELLRLRAASSGAALEPVTELSPDAAAGVTGSTGSAGSAGVTGSAGSAGATGSAGEGSPPAPDELPPSSDDLAQRQRYTNALLETIEVGIVACDADGTFLVSNRAERAMFGLDEGGLENRPMHFLGPHIDVFEDGRRLEPDGYPLMRALHGEDVSRLEVVAGPRGGPYRTLSVRGRQITDPGGRVLGAVAALTDVTAEREATRQLSDEHRRLVEAQRLGQLGSFEYDFATEEWSFSDHLYLLWGLDPDGSTAEMLSTLIADEDRHAVIDAWHTACERGEAQYFDLHVHRADDGATRLLRVSVEVELDGSGHPVHGRGTHLDITDVNAAQGAAQRANGFLNAILAATPDHTFVADVASGAVIYASPAKEVLGLASEELAALGVGGITELAHPDDRAAVTRAVGDATTLPDGEVVQVQYRARHADGQWRWLHQRVTPFRRGADGRAVEVLAVTRDVTDVVEAQQQLVHAAKHDYLTGLPNRALLLERLETSLRRSRHDRREVAVLFCDLDGFKRVNDVGGHAAGDAVLTEVARRLVAVVRDGDVVARMGGDEFVILIEPWNRSVAAAGRIRRARGRRSQPGRELAHRVAERVVEAIRRPVAVDGRSYTITGSVGIAYAPVGAATRGAPVLSADEILHHADMAMYRAKERGKDHVAVFEV
ncbi:MAG: diguanylate cyclase domain-containing protein [Acidimicrobiales bacterium]